MNDIVAIISSVGFPIVACIALFVILQRELKQINDTVANNTKAMTALLEHLREVEHGKE